MTSRDNELPGFRTPQVVMSKADPMRGWTEKLALDLQGALRTGRITVAMNLAPSYLRAKWCFVPWELAFLFQVDPDGTTWLDLRATETAAQHDVEDAEGAELALIFARWLRDYYRGDRPYEGRPAVLIDEAEALRELELATQQLLPTTERKPTQARGIDSGRAKSAASNRPDHRNDDEPFTKEARRRIEGGEPAAQVVNDIALRMPSKRGASTASKARRLRMRLQE